MFYVLTLGSWCHSTEEWRQGPEKQSCRKGQFIKEMQLSKREGTSEMSARRLEEGASVYMLSLAYLGRKLVSISTDLCSLEGASLQTAQLSNSLISPFALAGAFSPGWAFKAKTEACPGAQLMILLWRESTTLKLEFSRLRL